MVVGCPNPYQTADAHGPRCPAEEIMSAVRAVLAVSALLVIVGLALGPALASAGDARGGGGTTVSGNGPAGATILFGSHQDPMCHRPQQQLHKHCAGP